MARLCLEGGYRARAFQQLLLFRNGFASGPRLHVGCDLLTLLRPAWSGHGCITAELGGQAEFLRQFAWRYLPTHDHLVAEAGGALCAHARSTGGVGVDAPGEARRARRPRRLRCQLAERLGLRLNRALSGVLSDNGAANSSTSNSARLARYLAVERLASDPCLSLRPSAVHTNHHHVRPRFLRWVSKTGNCIAPPTRQGDYPLPWSYRCSRRFWS